jgi:hypothetical protein
VPLSTCFLSLYTNVTHEPYLSPMFALSKNQCRWNYQYQRDVEEVHAKFEELEVSEACLFWLGNRCLGGGGGRISLTCVRNGFFQAVLGSPSRTCFSKSGFWFGSGKAELFLGHFVSFSKAEPVFQSWVWFGQN